MKHTRISLFLSIVFLILCNAYISKAIFQHGAAKALSSVDFQSDEFRSQTLSESLLYYMDNVTENSILTGGDFMTALAALKGTWGEPFSPEAAPDYLTKWARILLRYNPRDFAKVRAAYAAIWNDLVCFPVDATVTYENTWMFERNYGGARGHEGTDLMPPENVSGYYSVVSITDGVVEKIGWLPLGGYRIGIRSPSGGYFYYAHLENYSNSFYVGESIDAGTELGTMGDTGYGEEGTRGRFPVHLHLGIYIDTEEAAELSVNPYWVLRYLERF